VEHLHHVEQNQERRLLAEEIQHQLQAPYASGAVLLDPSFYNPVPTPRPSVSQMNETSGANEPSFDPDAYMMDPIIPVYMERAVHDPTEEIERLRQEVEFLMLEAEERDELGDMFDDDATFTNTEYNFRAFACHINTGFGLTLSKVMVTVLMMKIR
jgi:hypothetical protein